MLKFHHMIHKGTIDRDVLIESCKSVKEMREGLVMLSNLVDPDIFYNKFRSKIKSFDKGVIFEGENTEPMFLLGASAVQSPLMKLIDSVIGIQHNSAYLTSTEAYLKKPHRELLKAIRKKPKLDIKELIKQHGFVDTWN